MNNYRPVIKARAYKLSTYDSDTLDVKGFRPSGISSAWSTYGINPQLLPSKERWLDHLEVGYF